MTPAHQSDALQANFLAAREQPPTEVVTRLGHFLRGAERSLDMAQKRASARASLGVSNPRG